MHDAAPPIDRELLESISVLNRMYHMVKISISQPLYSQPLLRNKLDGGGVRATKEVDTMLIRKVKGSTNAGGSPALVRGKYIDGSDEVLTSPGGCPPGSVKFSAPARCRRGRRTSAGDTDGNHIR